MYGVIIADECEFAPAAEYAQTLPSYSEGTDHGNKYVCFTTDSGSTVKAVWCGIGKVNAASAASFLISDGAKAMFNIGLSGSLEKSPVNGIVIGASTVEADFDLTPLGYEEFAKPGQSYIYKADADLLEAAKAAISGGRVGALACGDLFLTDAKRGEYLNTKYGISAFDMESGAVASVCNKCGVPFLALRQVSDSADENAAAEYTENNNRSRSDLLEALLMCIDKYDEVRSAK